MSFSPIIPNEGNEVRGVSGDLALMRGNFEALAPLVSGYVISGTVPSADLLGFDLGVAFRFAVSGSELYVQRLSGSTWLDVMAWPSGATGIRAFQVISGQTPTAAEHLATKGYVDAVELDDLADVVITGPTDGEGLVYSGGTWRNEPIAATLAGLGDVALFSPVSGESLVYNGVQWVNSGISGGSGSATLSGLTDVDVAGAVSGDVLTYSGGGVWYDQPYDRGVFSLADGTRPFTGTVSGVTPTQAAHLATKSYVDNLSGLSISGAITLSGLTDVDDAVDLAPDGYVLTISGGNWFALASTGGGSVDVLQVQIFS